MKARARKNAVRLLCVAAVLLLMLLAYPVRNRMTRGGFLLCAALVAALAIKLVWRWRMVRWGILLGLAAVAAGLVLPGRTVDVEALRRAYVARLEGYIGTRYVWGGENWSGVDCSGLLRAALVDAEIAEGLRTWNPGLLREAARTWWQDASAGMFMQGQGGAHEAGGAFVLKNGPAELRPGDFAVTADGSHVLAYEGEGKWIEADPYVLRVVRLEAGVASPWMESRVVPCRWACLEGGGIQGVNGASR